MQILCNFHAHSAGKKPAARLDLRGHHWPRSPFINLSGGLFARWLRLEAKKNET